MFLVLVEGQEGLWGGRCRGFDGYGKSQRCGGGGGDGWFWPRLISTCVPLLSEKMVEGQRDIANGLSNTFQGSVKDGKLAKLDQATEISIAYMNWI